MAIPFPLRSQITTHTRVLNLLRNNYCESEFCILILDRGLLENKNVRFLRQFKFNIKF